MTLISTKSGTDIYIEGKDGFSSSEILDSVKKSLESVSRDLPKDATVTGVTLLKPEETIPTVQPKQVEMVQVNVDRQKSARMGVTFQAINTALKSDDVDESISNRMKRVIATRVTTVDGKQVVIGDLATITVVKAPDAVVRKYP